MRSPDFLRSIGEPALEERKSLLTLLGKSFGRSPEAVKSDAENDGEY